MHGGGESEVCASLRQQNFQKPQVTDEKRQDFSGNVDAGSDEKKRGHGCKMYADNLEAEEREDRVNFLRRVGQLNRLSVQQRLEKHRENAERLFKLFSGSLGTAPASSTQEHATDSSSSVPLISLGDAVKYVLQGVGTICGRNFLVYLWQEHHMRTISAIQSNLRLVRQQADENNRADVDLRQKGSRELKLEGDFRSAIDSAELVYHKLYKKVHALATAVLGSDDRASSTGVPLSLDVSNSHDDFCSDAPLASERELGCGGQPQQEGFDCLIRDSEYLLRQYNDDPTLRSKRICVRHLLSHIRLIIADLHRYRDALEETFSSPEEATFANCIVPMHWGNDSISMQSSLPPRDSNGSCFRLVPFVGSSHLRNAAELYFQSLYLFADDAVSCSQLAALYIRLSAKATQYAQRLLRHKGQRKVLLRASRSAVEGCTTQHDSISFNPESTLVTYQLAALYWSYRSCICSFPLKTADPLTRLLKRLADSAVFNGKAQGSSGSLGRQTVDGAETLRNGPPWGWQHVSSSFAYLLQTVDLHLDLDDFPGKCLNFVLQMQRTLQVALPEENDSLMLVLLVLNAACCFLKSAGVMEPTQRVTAGIMARVKNNQTANSVLSGTNSDMDWVDITTRLYAAVPDAPLDSLKRIQLRLLQDGGSCEAALLLCCSVCVLFADAADELLRLASSQDANSLASCRGSEDGFPSRISESYLLERDLGALAALLAPLQCFLMVIHHSNDLFQWDIECLQHLRRRVAELVVRLFDWNTLYTAVVSRSRTRSRNGYMVKPKLTGKDDESNQNDVALCELENAIQLSLPEDWLLVGLGRHPVEIPRKKVLLVGPSDDVSSLSMKDGKHPAFTFPERADDKITERISADITASQPTENCSKQSTELSPVRDTSSDGEEEELLLRVPLIVRMCTTGCTEGPTDGLINDEDASPQYAPDAAYLALGGHHVQRIHSNSNPLLNLRVRAARLLVFAMESRELDTALSTYWGSSRDASSVIPEEGSEETSTQKPQGEAAPDVAVSNTKPSSFLTPQQRRGSVRGQLRKGGAPIVSCNWRHHSVRLRKPPLTGGRRGSVEAAQLSPTGTVDPGKLVRTNSKQRLIVIDGSNVAMGHGGGSVVKATSAGLGMTKPRKVFSTEGICTVVSYYEERGYKVLVFVPQYVVGYDSVGEAKRMEKANIPVSGARLPDNVEALLDLKKRGILIATPSKDYDDLYITRYAMMHDGCIVSNDMYRDVVKRASTLKRELMLKQGNWIRRHSISFVFVEDEFLPNPDFRWPDDDGEGRQLALELEYFLMECGKADLQE